MIHPALIQFRTLSFSVSTAETLGLEAAVLLNCLEQWSAAMPDSAGWWELDNQRLLNMLPFWKASDIRRIMLQLSDTGIVEMTGFIDLSSRQWRFRFAGQATPGPAAEIPKAKHSDTAKTSPLPGLQPIAEDWQPDPQLLVELEQHHGIPPEFARQQRDEFVRYWGERGEPAHSWSSRFRDRVLARWQRGRRGVDKSIGAHWQPAEHTITELADRIGVSPGFIDDSIGEFIAYWLENDPAAGNWNARFLRHVKKQWQLCNSRLSPAGEPTPLLRDWQPSEDVLDILSTGGIGTDFAHSKLPEFVLYWRDRGEARASWDSCFLNFVRRQADGRQEGFAHRHTDPAWRHGA